MLGKNIHVYFYLTDMCGIWAYISKQTAITKEQKLRLYEAFGTIKHRGPDRSTFTEINNKIKIVVGFHRLAIMDKSSRGDQPFVCTYENRTIYCICNGEIYNFKELIQKYNLTCKSGSDCEVIPLIYMKFGHQQLVNDIKTGEFSFVILDVNHKTDTVNIFVGRDPCGVRPLFFAEDTNGIIFSSELKGLLGCVKQSNISQFEPGTVMQIQVTIDDKHLITTKSTSHKYFDVDKITEIKTDSFDIITSKIRTCLEKSVISMLESDRPLGALLSGGLDSSLVVAIASKYLRTKYNRKLATFSIGLEGSTDEKYAHIVAEYCGTDHTHITVKTEDFLKAVPDVVRATETFDITTIRASTGQYLISKWIAENTDIKVLLCGDGSDELCSGYMYFHRAPNPLESHKENCRLLKDIHIFDVLRADRGISYHGLEGRVPFLCSDFIETYLSTEYSLRVPHSDNDKKIEKWLLRKSFASTDYLPQSVLYRKKEAFSDGVSSVEKSWYKIIQELANKIYSDQDLKDAQEKYKHLPPISKESLYFREMFVENFDDDCSHVIPYYWLPKWSPETKDPSARTLAVYSSKN